MENFLSEGFIPHNAYPHRMESRRQTPWTWSHDDENKFQRDINEYLYRMDSPLWKSQRQEPLSYDHAEKKIERLMAEAYPSKPLWFKSRNEANKHFQEIQKSNREYMEKIYYSEIKENTKDEKKEIEAEKKQIAVISNKKLSKKKRQQLKKKQKTDIVKHVDTTNNNADTTTKTTTTKYYSLNIEITECPVCFEKFDETPLQRPRVFVCGHSVCTKCIESIQHLSDVKTEMKCPECSSITKLPSNKIASECVKVNIVLEKLIITIKKQQEVAKIIDEIGSHDDIALQNKLLKKRLDQFVATKINSFSVPSFSQYEVGEQIDAKDKKNNWYPATVIENNLSSGCIYVKFHMWKDCHNEYIYELSKIAKRGTVVPKIGDTIHNQLIVGIGPEFFLMQNDAQYLINENLKIYK